jgi:hypothetical protein
MILALAVVARLGVALLMGNSVVALPGIADQVSYHALAQRVATGHGFSFGSYWWPSTPADAPTAFWSYLYTLALAAFYFVGGIHPLIPRLFQAVAAGLLLPWLSYRVSQQVFKESAQREMIGLLAAGWAAGYGYFVYYAPALMTESLYLITILWVMDCSLRILAFEPISQPKPIRLWLELGLALGLTGLFRQVFLPFVPFLFLWLFWASKESTQWPHLKVAFGQTVRGGLMVGAIMAGLFLPFTAYNYARFGRVVLLNTNAGSAFFWANHPIYGDTFYSILPDSMGSYLDLIPPELRGLNEAELDSALLQRGLQFVVDDPGRYLRLSLSRIPIYFQFWPATDSSLLSNIVRVMSFGLALPFMVVGLWLWLCDCVRGQLNWRTGGLLLLFATVYSLVHLLSWTLIRYRLPVDLVLLVFAARALWLALATVGENLQRLKPMQQVTR